MCVKQAIKKSYLFFKDNYNYVTSTYLLLCRIYVFIVFFQSGWLKLENAVKGNWYITEYLFEHEYNILFIHYKVAAVIGTFSELFFPILLVLGLVSRASAFVVISMILLMSLNYLHHDEHTIWGILFLNILVYGALEYFLLITLFLKRRSQKYSN